MTFKAWMAALAMGLALVLASARCGHDVQLGVDPKSDAAPSGSADAGADVDGA